MVILTHHCYLGRKSCGTECVLWHYIIPQLLNGALITYEQPFHFCSCCIHILRNKTH